MRMLVKGSDRTAYKDFGNNQLARWTEAIVVVLADHVGDYPNEDDGEPELEQANHPCRCLHSPSGHFLL